MKYLQRYAIVILVVLPVIVLVLIRVTATDRFKKDALRHAAPSIDRSNLVSRGQLGQFTSGYLIIDLDDKESLSGKRTGDSILHLPAGSLLEKPGQKVLRSQNMPVLLYSSKTSVSARIWMLLSQMGYRDLYILADEAENEVMKYKFRPDTLPAGTAF